MVSYSDGGRIFLFADRAAATFLQAVNFAKQCAPRNPCLRKVVPAMLFSNNRNLGKFEIMVAHNGPVIAEQACENIEGSCGCAHVEPRLILQALRTPQFVTRQSLMYCFYSPCTHCANLLIDSHLIGAFIYDELYRDTRGLSILSKVMPVGTIQELKGGNYASIEKWVSDNR